MWRRTASALALLAATAAPAMAEGIRLVPRIAPAETALSLQRMHDFEATLSLRLRTDPRRLTPDRRREYVRSLDLADRAGRPVGEGFAVESAHDVVVGFSGGSVEIVRTGEGGEAALSLLTLFKDDQGRIVAPEPDQLTVVTPEGEPLCFEQQSALASGMLEGMWFFLLLDRSGSMSGYIPDVLATARAFLDALPESAHCSVYSFADSWITHSPGSRARPCRADAFNLGGLEAGGGTDLFTPLSHIYRHFGEDSEYAAWQRAVIAITDGRVSGSYGEGGDATSLAGLKGETLTFVYWLGDHNEAGLQSLADSYIEHQGSLRTSLARYFEILSEAYNLQQVLTLHECPAGADHAAR